MFIDILTKQKKVILFGIIWEVLGKKNNGMRIDHFLVSNSLIDQVKSININKDPRGREKPSDHTPIEIKLA